MSTIKTGTTLTTAYQVEGDTTGALVIQTGSTPTTAMTLSSAQVVTFANPPSATGGGAVSSNTAYGSGALAANTTGAGNDAFGSTSLQANTTGNNNVAVGRGALTANTGGSSNTSVGYLSLGGNTTASNNTAVGFQAGYSKTTGDDNTFIGRFAGYSSTTNYSNTFVGKNTGYGVTTGYGNTFIGSNVSGEGCGQYVTTGTKNTIVGGFSGNSGGLDIRTLSNWVVLSDGDGDPVFYTGTGVGYIDGRYFVCAKNIGTTNLNTIFKPGMYRVDIGAANTPTNNYYALNVYGNGGNVTTQIATVVAGTATYVRSYNTSWSSWVAL